MAEADPLLDEYLTDQDRDTIGTLGQPTSVDASPVPAGIDEIAPPGVAAALPPPLDPGVEGPEEPLPEAVTAPIPPGQASVPGQPPTGASAIPTLNQQQQRDLNLADAEAVSTRQGELDAKRAGIEAKMAEQQAADAKAAAEENAVTQSDYLQRRQQAEGDLDARTKAYENTKLIDPRERTNTFKSVVSVIFGGLGAAFRSAGGGDSKNTALANLQQQWENDTELQKANIAALKDQAVMARTRLTDVDEGRRHMLRDADARLVAKYNLALKQGEAQLKNQGVDQASIDADKRIVTLRQGKLEAEAKAKRDEDAHALAMARAAAASRKAAGGVPDDLRAAQIRVMNARAAALEKKAKGKDKGAGGGAGGGRSEAVAQYLIDNPGDIPGAMRLAGPGFDSKKFDKIVNQTKGTEGQNKNAQQAKIGLDAIDEIEKGGYKPTREEIQKWINNQRLTASAAAHDVKGAALTVGQWFNLVPQSEVEGLSPEAQKYFANVRRYVEPIARSQSGAAISQSEWENFFNQYGPNSAGGIDAARQYLKNTGRVSGVAGRSLDNSPPPAAPIGGGSKPVTIDEMIAETKGGKAAKSATPAEHPATPEALQWAKKNLADPRAKEILRRNGGR